MNKPRLYAVTGIALDGFPGWRLTIYARLSMDQAEVIADQAKASGNYSDVRIDPLD